MRFIKLGSKYFVKNSWWLLLLWLVPSVFVGMLTGPFQIVEFINKYPTTVISGFGDIFKILMSISWQKVVFALIGVILISVFLSMSVGQMESHMRSGKLNFKEIFSYINNDILVVVINVIVIEIINLFLTFILGSVIFLFHLLLSGLSSVPSILTIVIAITLCCLMLLLYGFILTMFLINIPNMITNGYSFKEGVSSTAQLIGKNGFRLIVAYLLPYVVIIPFVSLLCKTNLLWIANVIGCWLMGAYYSSLTMTAYFELSDTNRYDNRKYYNYK